MSKEVYRLCYELNNFLGKETEDVMTLCVMGKDRNSHWDYCINSSKNVNQNRLIANVVLGFEEVSDSLVEIYHFGNVQDFISTLRVHLENLQ